MNKEKCKCYCKDEYLAGYTEYGKAIYEVRERCFGTKEKDVCSCEGNEDRCDYYRKGVEND